MHTWISILYGVLSYVLRTVVYSTVHTVHARVRTPAPARQRPSAPAAALVVPDNSQGLHQSFAPPTIRPHYVAFRASRRDGAEMEIARVTPGERSGSSVNPPRLRAQVDHVVHSRERHSRPCENDEKNRHGHPQAIERRRGSRRLGTAARVLSPLRARAHAQCTVLCRRVRVVCLAHDCLSDRYTSVRTCATPRSHRRLPR